MTPELQRQEACGVLAGLPLASQQAAESAPSEARLPAHAAAFSILQGLQWIRAACPAIRHPRCIEMAVIRTGSPQILPRAQGAGGRAALQVAWAAEQSSRRRHAHWW